MHAISLSRLAIVGWLILVAGSAVSAPIVVENTAEPAAGLQVVDLVELWRAGGENDDVFFGNLGAVRSDTQGRIYLLDSQLSEVHVYSPEGEYLKVIGREGDGPGETRRPQDLFITGDGLLNLVQTMPGRIVKLTQDGEPAGGATYTTESGSAGQFGVMIAGRAAGENMALAGIRMVFDGGANHQTYYLALCDLDGLQKAALHEKTHMVNMADFRLDELEMDFVWNRLDTGPDGRVYAGIERNSYEINIYSPDGALERKITRPYDSPPRTERQKVVARQIVAAVGANYPSPPQAITIEDSEPVLSNLMVDDAGRIWTQTSLGNRNTPDGTWVVLDVFAPDGTFARQVALRGDHDPSRDLISLLPGGRLVVVVGALDAWLTQQGVSDQDEAGAEGGDPLEVVCYRMDGTF